MEKRRRDFLKTAGAVSAAIPPLGVLASRPAESANTSGLTPAEAAESGINLRTFAEAEKLTGVPYTNVEREQMLGTIAQQIERARQIRALGMDNAGPAPALAFDPRLPGTQMPKPAWRRATAREIPAVPTLEADIAFAPATVLSEWLRSGRLECRFGGPRSRRCWVPCETWASSWSRLSFPSCHTARWSPSLPWRRLLRLRS